MTPEHFLVELRNSLKAQNVSLLVGSGFSKNVSELYPDWKTLLNDMARELYEHQIKIQYNLSHGKAFSPSDDDYEKYLNEELQLKIFETGYLELVSEFIRRHNYREVLESYIEEHIPRIVRREEQKLLQYKEKEEIKELLLKEVDFMLPAKLLGLPWTNVFTTNYDTVLEDSIDLRLYHRQKQAIEALHHDKSLIEEAIKRREIEYVKLRDEQLQLQTGAPPNIETESQWDKTPIMNDEFNSSERMNVITGRQHLLRREIDNDIRQLTKIIGRIEHFSLSLNDYWTLITDSADLDIKKNRNIIKLHGTLRHFKDDLFQFDGDAQRCYIISKEDYDTYPTKHEAFTQLMRISLLRDTFCLIGFSGNDPNFMGWLNWVRDVLMRKPAGEASSNKIFFIDVSGNEPSAQKKAFYANHRIAYIPLMDEGVLSYLARQTDHPVPALDDRSGALRLLLEHLQQSLLYSGSELKTWQLLVQDYEALWIKLAPSGYNNLNPTIIVENIDQLKSLKRQIKYPDIQFRYHSTRQLTRELGITAINSANTVVEKLAVLEFILVAVKESYLPLSSVYSTEDIDIILKEASSWLNLSQSFLELRYIDAVWRNDSDLLTEIEERLSKSTGQTFDVLIQYKIIYFIQNLRFREAKDILDKWLTTNENACIKGGLASLFDLNMALFIINEFDTVNPQELFHKLMLQHFLKWVKRPLETEQDERLKLLIDAGVNTLDGNFNYLIRVIKQKKEHIVPAGDDLFTITRTIDFDNSPKEMESIQFLGLLMDSGLPLAFGDLSFKTPEDFIEIALYAMDYYCLPVFFYIIQSANETLCRVAAQKLCYHSALIEVRNIIALNIIRAFTKEELQPNIRRSLKYFLAELIITYEPETWEHIFERVWLEEETELFQSLYKNKHSFILKGLCYVRNVNIIITIITSCLKNRNLEQSNPSIGYLFKLSTNPFYREQVHILRNDKSIVAQIDETIKSLGTTTMHYVLLLGNTYSLLTSEQLNQVRQQISNAELMQFESSTIWNVLIYFFKSDLAMKKKIAAAVLESKSLWDGGIDDDLRSSSSTYNFISVRAITKVNETSDGIEWTPEEVGVIAHKLIKEFEKIKQIIAKNLSSGYVFQNYEAILHEMVDFVSINRNVLYDLISEELAAEIKSTYFQQRGFKSIEDGLTSNDKAPVILALNHLSSRINQNNSLGAVLSTIEFVLIRTLLMKEPGLAESIEYLSRWIIKYKASSEVSQLTPRMKLLIKKYRYVLPVTSELPSFQAAMIRIAYSLRFLGEENEDINYWMNVFSTSEFLNIKYVLAKKIVTNSDIS